MLESFRATINQDGPIIFGSLCGPLIGLRTKISCHFCVWEGLKYSFSGGISNSVTMIMDGVKLTMSGFCI